MKMRLAQVSRRALRRALYSASILTGAAVCPAVVHAQPVQGLYIAGEGGASFNQAQRVRSGAMVPGGGRDHYDTGVTGIGSLGYGLGNGFRVEVEGDYRNNGLRKFGTNDFRSSVGGRQQTYGVMANALFDMDIGKSWLFPYFGAGVGYAWQGMNAHVTPMGGQMQSIGGTFGNFAYQGIFGLAFPVPWVVGLSATAEYRFWTMLGPQSHTATTYGASKSDVVATGNRDTNTDFNHSLMLGLRYEFNPAPPPPPAPVMAAVPAPVVARTYLVFFDWDSAALSDRARAIVAQAAQATTHTEVTRIEVNGYTDNSAAHPGMRGEKYNMALSVRRADTVRAELVRDGVPGPSIAVQGFGEAHPLVVTAANTREPQNRRVEIILK
ncbi:outer membrane protein [Ameyamaea chiangmaiensis NBRC 103196]|uniref:OmpA family protein n=1 Tax=Ameyamaea chiangmaiensis TaxID=442969 RepID=A0A850P7V8_9PROT|nr:OmpA family protein [Ameyamaea chiangmaiensis]MBS4075133.1 OmpA family protein [Ameyamaea chiangmaiensis]NVN40695.1 OmpA family protein [Ameyamaea chiangmaiensis]GBQ66191.1 outer membrane protein [Ameyamaea chiangmaiensis NBRC 103196]